MEPTLKVGDRIATVKKGRLKRGDIVLLQAPEGDNEKLIKRVIGLPYETVEIKNRKVFINGEGLYERYVKEPAVYTLKAETGENGYFLLGDNRNESEDSSSWGPVGKEFIRGRVFCRYWPLKNFKIFTRFTITIR
jgi:signal peptidase I